MFNLIQVEIPGKETLTIRNLLLDFNGTIAKDGILIAGVAERLRKIAEEGVDICMVTADTNGTVASQCKGLPFRLEVFDGSEITERKKETAQQVGLEVTAAIGNGCNDREMFKACALSIAVIGAEGCFTATLATSDIVVADIRDALDLLLHKNRLIATLRP